MRVKDFAVRYNIDVNKLRFLADSGIISLKDAYTQEELEGIGLILTLYDCGFSIDRLRDYLAMGVEGRVQRQIDILCEGRYALLEEIHVRERLLDKLDYIIFTLRRDK